MKSCLGDMLMIVSPFKVFSRLCAGLVVGAGVLAPAGLNAAADRALYYYQSEWGTPAALGMTWTESGGVAIQAPNRKLHEIWEDAVAVGDWKAIEAQWSDVEDWDIRPVIFDQSGNRWIGSKKAVTGINTWSTDDFTLLEDGGLVPTPAAIPAKILRTGWRIVPPAEGSRCTLDACELVREGGERIRLFADLDAPNPFYVPGVESRPEAPDVDVNSTRVVLSLTGLRMNLPQWREEWLIWGNREFPGQFAIDTATWYFPDLVDLVEQAKAMDILPIGEFHRTKPGRQAYLFNHGLTPTRDDGFNPASPIWPSNSPSNQYHHFDDTTNEEVFKLTEERLDMMFDLGYQVATLIDYVWIPKGGRWGYGEAAVTQWKKYLNGEGWTLDLVDPAETWTFEDYWEHFTSIPLKPETFGWDDWSQFTCGREMAANKSDIERRRLILFNALWHFHYLVFAERMGLAAEARNGQLDLFNGSEIFTTGCDLTTLGRMEHVGGIGFEFFGNPLHLDTWSHVMPPLRWREGGPAVNLIGEINAGGGFEVSRYDREVAFAFYYGVTASVLPRYCNIQYPKDNNWANWKTLNEDQLGRFDHWFAGNNAFLLRHAEEKTSPVRPLPVTVIFSRSILEYQPSSSHTLRQEGNLAAYLSALQVDYEAVGRDGWDAETDTHTRTLFFSPSMATPAQIERVGKWIGEGSGKVLVLHGGAAWRRDYSPEVPNSTARWAPARYYRQIHVPGEDAPFSGSFVPLAEQKRDVPISLDGESLKTGWWEAAMPKQILLADDNGVPLVTEWIVGENRVLHIMADLPVEPSRIGLEIMQAVCGAADVPAFATSLPGWSVEHFGVSGGDVVIAWDKDVLVQQEETSAGQNDLPGKFTRFDRVPLETAVSLSLKVEPGKDYLVHNVFARTTERITSTADGLLEVPMSQTPEMIYYGPVSPEIEETVRQAEQTYNDVLARTRVREGS